MRSRSERGPVRRQRRVPAATLKRTAPEWTEGRVFYHLHSLGAAGAPTTNPDVDAPEPTGRGLRRLQGWLDHVRSLGCGGVILTPVFVASTHGYDTVDPFRIDQRLGGDDDFDAFVEACHERDLKVVLDGVFNHVGRAFGPFRDVLRDGRGSPSAGWFRIDFDGAGPDGFGYRTFEGHHELVALDHRSAVVLEWATAVATHWLDRGADGWRFDAAYAIPTEFLATLNRRIRNSHPDAFLFGEVIHGDYSRFVEESGLDAVTQYELYKAIWSSLNDANFFELAWALERHHAYTATFTPVTFAGNHDVTRLATQLDDPSHAGCATAILCTVPGMPCIYYGDELGWEGRKEARPGGDDAIRPPLPERASGDDAVHRQLITFRRDRPWLTAADITVTERANRHIGYAVSDGTHAISVTLDLDAEPQSPPAWRTVARGSGWLIAEP